VEFQSGCQGEVYEVYSRSTPESEVMLNMDTTEEVVRLTATAHPFYSQVIRVAVFLVASRLDFDLEQVEDLRIAVDEAWNHALTHTPLSSDIEVEIAVAPESMRITLTSEVVEAYEESRGIPASFSRLILDAVSDEVSIEHADGRCRMVLYKYKDGTGAQDG
jgi:serine/threonine-protein kinase RsbW